MTDPQLHDPRDSMAAGFDLGFFLHMIGQPILGAVAALLLGIHWFMMPALFMGWSQLAYMIPAAIWCQVKGRRRAASMLWIMTSVAFLLTSACSGLFYDSWGWFF